MSDTTLADPALASSVDEFFADQVEAGRAELERTGSLPAQLWASTEDLGLSLVGIAEPAGGSGGSLHDILTVVMSSARHAVPLPVAETHLAAWLLASAGVDVPAGAMTVVPPDSARSLQVSDGTVRGTALDVSWARAVGRVVALVDDPDGVPHIVSFDPSGCVARVGENLAGEPTAAIDIDQPAQVCEPAPFGPDRFAWHGALIRTAQLAGALESVARITQRYVGERVQFGKPIGRFQAVQQHVVTVAQASEMTTMSLWRAAAAYAQRDASFEVCAAKLTGSESARISVRAAHQAHGAIGMTREYPLHLYTRRLNLWRQQFGTERQLSTALGTAVSAAPSFARVLSDHDNGLAVAWPTI
jgi:acyl-CoA dehydrogenase